MTDAVSNYDNDRRVRTEPICGTFRLVKTMFFGEVAIIEGDDGVHRAFEYEQVNVPAGEFWLHGSKGVRLGDQLDVPEGDFDSVVHALIGGPQ